MAFPWACALGSVYGFLQGAWPFGVVEAKLIQLATTDSLTGLLTRRAFFEIAGKMQRNTGAGHPLSILICDLDKFKLINDTYGHEVGDFVLRSVSAEAKAIDVPVGRLGGEEFAFLVQARLDDAVEIADRFRRTVCELAIRAGTNDIAITCSIGAAEWEPGDSIDTLLRRADVSLYEAKRSGRNRVAAADTFAISQNHDHWHGIARLSPR